MDGLEKFLKENSRDGGFLQSEIWENFQKSLNKKTFSFFRKEKIRCLAIKHELPLAGGYFFVPRGPIMKILNFKFEILNECINELIKNAEKDRIGWIRLELQRFEDLELVKKNLSGKLSVKKSRKDHQPPQTLMLDLDRSEEELLSQMKPKTRYNIRVCQKNQVEIIEDRSKKYFEALIKLIQETAERNKVQFHSRGYYAKMMAAASDDNLKLYSAVFDGQIIGSILVSFYGEIATYLHGASSDAYRNKMAVYGLQWQAIKDAKQNGCRKYDFGGLSEITEKHPELREKWAGITRFKRGFAPQEKLTEFPGCWDIILNKNKYRLYRFAQKLKSFRFLR